MVGKGVRRILLIIVLKNYTPPPLSSTGVTLLSGLRDFFDSGGAAAKSLSVAHTYRTDVS